MPTNRASLQVQQPAKPIKAKVDARALQKVPVDNVDVVQHSLSKLMDDSHVATGAPSELAEYRFPAQPPSGQPAFPHTDRTDFPFPAFAPDIGYCFGDDPFLVAQVQETAPHQKKRDPAAAPIGNSLANRRKSLYISTPPPSVLLASTSTPPLTPAGPSPSSNSLRLATPTDEPNFRQGLKQSADYFESPEILQSAFAVTPDHQPIDPLQKPQKQCQGNADVTMTERLLADHPLLPAFASNFHIEAELGTGGFGFVVRARRLRDGALAAVKFIIKENMPPHMWRYDPRWCHGQSSLPSEAIMLMDICHEGVVAFYDLMEDHKFFYLIMEYHGSPWAQHVKGKGSSKVSNTSPGSFTQPSSSPTRNPQNQASPSKLQLPVPQPPPFIRRSSCDLFECIESRSRLSENEARFIFAQILCAVRHLHRHGIYHMDLKDENIVIDDQLRVKLIDFGSAVRCAPDEKFKRFFGTLAYASPEVLRHQPYLAGPGEIWALGIIFSILLVGESLYREPADVLDGRYNQAAFQSLSRHSQHILCLCLDQNTLSRVNIEDLCAVPWLAPIVDEIERAHERLRLRGHAPTLHQRQPAQASSQ